MEVVEKREKGGGSSYGLLVKVLLSLCLLACGVLVTGMVMAAEPTVAYADDTLPVSGTCGTAKWEIDTAGELYIHDGVLGSNTDSIYNYYPWYQYKYDIRTVRMSNLIAGDSVAHMFYYCSGLSSIDLSPLDTSNVTNMSWMFSGCSGLSSIDLSPLDTSNVTSMRHMFDGCSGLSSIDLSPLDTSNVTDMRYMFFGCSGLSSIDLSPLDTSNVTDMYDMFYDCSNLVQITVNSQNHRHLFSSLSSSFSSSTRWKSKATSQWYTMDELIASRNEVADTYSRTGEFIDDGSGTHHGRRTVPFQMFGQAALSNNQVRTLALPWDENWFARSSTAYNHELGQAMSVLTSSAYDKTGTAARQNLRLLGCVDSKIDAHYPKKEDYRNSTNRVAYSFGLDDSDPNMPLVYVLVRGTPGNVEWESNFNMSSYGPGSPYHTGFYQAALYLMLDLRTFVEGTGVTDLSKARIVVTGHSRGAGVANLVGAMLDDGMLKNDTGQSATERTFVYTFAAPPGTTQGNTNADKYANIFNIVNPQDVVPRVPLAQWKFSRYGITKQLLSKSNAARYYLGGAESRMRAKFAEITGGQTYQPYPAGACVSERFADLFYSASPSVRSYNNDDVGPYCTMSMIMRTIGNDALGGNGAPIGKESPTKLWYAIGSLLLGRPNFAKAVAMTVIGDGTLEGLEMCYRLRSPHIPVLTPFVHAHAQETYIAWMLSGTENEVFGSSYRGLKVACPVDVRIYDAEDNLVCEIVDDVVNEDVMATGLAAMVIGEDKYIDIPSDDQYRFEIVPRNDGEMDVTLTDYGSGGTADSKVAYTDLSLEPGQGYGAQVAADADDLLTAEEEIEMAASGVTVAADAVASAADAVNDISVTVSTASGDGMTEGNAKVMPNEKVTVNAIPADGAEFLGWYDGDTLVSMEPEYSFRPRESVALSASFTQSLAMATATEIPAQAYTSGEIQPPLVLSYRGETVPASAYDVSFEDNIHPGTARAIAVARDGGGFTGQLMVEFEISWPFKDVNGDTFHADDILWLCDNEITSGFPDNTFRPLDSVARCDMAAFLFRLARKWGVVDDSWQPSAAQQSAFSDVNENTPHAREVWWLASQGISGGWEVAGGKKEFRPYAMVARQDMAAFLFRLARAAGRGDAGGSWQASEESKARFRDVSATAPDNHHDEVWWLAEKGVSTGWDVGGGKYEFRGLLNVARCDMAAFLRRMDGLA